MERLTIVHEGRDRIDEQEFTAPPIFGLRYLEEEAAEIHDVVGCLMSTNLVPTGCDETHEP